MASKQGIFKAKPPESTCLETWKRILEIKEEDKYKFQTLRTIVEALYSIPYSNADIERTFNFLGLIKTDRRSRLNEGTLRSLLIAKTYSKKKNFNFNEYLEQNYKKVKQNMI